MNLQANLTAAWVSANVAVDGTTKQWSYYYFHFFASFRAFRLNSNMNVISIRWFFCHMNNKEKYTI
uniref:Uncharacterized protein n=1 Tax=Anguilla anguilla TaxID=7936 RepID=A0A0E9WUT2_ANGAN